MLCPHCHAINPATAVYCMQCRSVLIPQALPRDSQAQAAEDIMRRRMATGIGAFAGTAIAALAGLATVGDTPELKAFLVAGAAVGAGLGRYIAWKSTQLL